jgi:hypothetical protein
VCPYLCHQTRCITKQMMAVTSKSLLLYMLALASVVLVIMMYSKILCAWFQRRRCQRSASTEVVASDQRILQEASHVCFRHEWILGVLVMIILVYLRIIHYQQGSWLGENEWEKNVFQNQWSPEWISNRLQSYCAIDLEILCANQGESYRMDEGCNADYGPFLARKLHIGALEDENLEKWTRDQLLNQQQQQLPHDDTPSGSAAVFALDDLHKCALAMQMEINGWTYLVRQWGYPTVEAEELEPFIQNRTLLKDKDAVTVAKAILMVISTIMPNEHYTCSHRMDRRAGSVSNGQDLVFTTEGDQEALYEFYLKELLDVFATNKAVDGRIVSRTWTQVEFLDIASAAFELLQPSERRRLMPFVRAAAQMAEKQEIQDQEASSRRRQLFSISSTSGTVSSVHSLGGGLVVNDETYPNESYQKHDFRLFHCNDLVDQCMYSHLENRRLVTEICTVRMKQAQSRMRELQCPVSPDFVFITHFSFLLVNLLWVLMLVRSCSIRNKYKQSLDKKRRQLEQELNDPFLRESLERKAQMLPEAERVRFFAGLEHRIRHWDSSAGATKHTKRWLRRFRYMILFVTLLNVCFGFFLIKWQIESRAQFLENLFVAVFMWTLSYTARVPEGRGWSASEESTASSITTLQMSSIGEASTEASVGLLSKSEEAVKTDLA